MAWKTAIDNSSPSASPSRQASTPSTAASNSRIWTVINLVAPWGRMSAISLRREGTVTNIALSANMKPTNALIAENNASLWLSGATATPNSVES